MGQQYPRTPPDCSECVTLGQTHFGNTKRQTASRLCFDSSSCSCMWQGSPSESPQLYCLSENREEVHKLLTLFVVTQNILLRQLEQKRNMSGHSERERESASARREIERGSREVMKTQSMMRQDVNMSFDEQDGLTHLSFPLIQDTKLEVI